MDKRLESEIQEILEKSTSNFSNLDEVPRIENSTPRPSFLRKIHARFSTKRFLLVGISLMLSAVIVGMISPEFKSGFLFWTGLTLFIIAYAFYFTRPPSNSHLRWRGRPVKYEKDSK